MGEGQFVRGMIEVGRCRCQAAVSLSYQMVGVVMVLGAAEGEVGPRTILEETTSNEVQMLAKITPNQKIQN